MSDQCPPVVHYICAVSILLAAIAIVISTAHLTWVARHIARFRAEQAAKITRLGESLPASSDETEGSDRQPLLPPAPR
jgi:hypothetical protein